MFSKFIEQVEKAIDANSHPSHASISRQMESLLINLKPELDRKYGIVPSDFDFTYTPVIQSGKDFSIKLNLESNSEKLVQNYILMNMGCKYNELNTNAFRTLIINPSEKDKIHYKALLDIHKHTISLLKAGS